MLSSNCVKDLEELSSLLLSSSSKRFFSWSLDDIPTFPLIFPAKELCSDDRG